MSSGRLPRAREKSSKISAPVPAKNPRPPGRPTKLDDVVADRLVALVSAGATITDAAAELGVTRRTVQLWRARAWSRDPRDAPHVELERRLRDALAGGVGAAGQPTRSLDELAPDDWREIAARLEANDPLRWELDDGL